MFNARRLDRGLNVFVGVFKNKYFLVIFLISTSPLLPRRVLLTSSLVVGGQILIVQVGGAAFHVVPIGGRDWAVSLVLGSLSMPLAVLIRLLPPAPFERFMIRCKFFPDPNAVLPTVSPASDEKQWNEGQSRASFFVE
jgi:Ca2+-transporting ATPase